MIIGIIQNQMASSWKYIGITGAANDLINRGNIPRCNLDETGSLDYLNSNYPARNYQLGYIVEVASTSGFFPNTVTCDRRFFRAV